MTHPAGWACPPTFPHNHYFRHGKSLCGEYGYRSKNPENFKTKNVPNCEICSLQLNNLKIDTAADGAYEEMRAKVSSCVDTAEQKYGKKWPEVRESIRDMLSRQMAKHRVKSMEEMAEILAVDAERHWGFALIAAAAPMKRKKRSLTKS